MFGVVPASAVTTTCEHTTTTVGETTPTLLVCETPDPTTTTAAPSLGYEGPSASQFEEAHQDLLTAGAFAVFFLAVGVAAAWRRSG
jgi:hypothetical protein